MADNALPRLLPALRKLISWFNATKTPYLVIGGVAVTLIARARATRDIDSVVLIDEKDPVGFVASGAPFGFFSREAKILMRARTSRMLLLTHRPSKVDVDVSLGGLAFEQESIARAVTVSAGGIEVRVPTAEDLIIMKAVASRAIDLGDIDMILDMQPGVDRARIRATVREFAELLEQPEIAVKIEPLLKAKRLPVHPAGKRPRKSQ